MRIVAVVALAVTAFSGCALGVKGPVTDITLSSAVVHGSVASTLDGPAPYWVEYGTTTSYGAATPHQTANLDKGVGKSVAVDLHGLTADATYHYRICARDSDPNASPGCSADGTFTTKAVTCGQPVTEDVTLSKNLECPGDTIVVGADDITIDLGGHTISETFGPASTGILNAGGYDGVTIRNGTVGGSTPYQEGVKLVGASGNRLTGLHFAAFGAIQLEDSSENVVKDNAVHGIEDNLRLIRSDDNRLVDNEISADGNAGVALDDSDGNRVARNSIIGGATSVLVQGSDNNEIVRNHVHDTFALGLMVASGTGNLIAHNTVERSTKALGEEYGDGILIQTGATNTSVLGNVVTANEGDGIDAQSSTTSLGRNTATNNDELGIEAVAGVTNLGGNLASGNGNPLQCQNVFCQ